MTTAAATSRGAMRRLMKELDTWTNVEFLTEEGIERLGPVSDDELLEWEAVINGRGVGCGYDSTFPFLSLCFPPVFDPIWLLRRYANAAINRRPLAPPHHHPPDLPFAPADHQVRNAHRARQR